MEVDGGGGEMRWCFVLCLFVMSLARCVRCAADCCEVGRSERELSLRFAISGLVWVEIEMAGA